MATRMGPAGRRAPPLPATARLGPGGNGQTARPGPPGQPAETRPACTTTAARLAGCHGPLRARHLLAGCTRRCRLCDRENTAKLRVRDFGRRQGWEKKKLKHAVTIGSSRHGQGAVAVSAGRPPHCHALRSASSQPAVRYAGYALRRVHRVMQKSFAGRASRGTGTGFPPRRFPLSLSPQWTTAVTAVVISLSVPHPLRVCHQTANKLF